MQSTSFADKVAVALL